MNWGFKTQKNLLAELAVYVVWSWVWVNRFPLLPVGLVGGVQPFEFEEIEVPKNAQANDLHQSGVDRCWLLPHLQVVVSMGCCQNASPSDQKERQCVFQSRNDGEQPRTHPRLAPQWIQCTEPGHGAENGHPRLLQLGGVKGLAHNGHPPSRYVCDVGDVVKFEQVEPVSVIATHCQMLHQLLKGLLGVET